MVLGAFLVTLGDLWATFSDFLRVLETGLKFDDFCRDTLGGPRLRHPTQLVVTPCFLAYSKQLPITSLLICKQLKADTRLANC